MPPGGKGIELMTLPPSCADSLEILGTSGHRSIKGIARPVTLIHCMKRKYSELHGTQSFLKKKNYCCICSISVHKRLFILRNKQTKAPQYNIFDFIIYHYAPTCFSCF